MTAPLSVWTSFYGNRRLAATRLVKVPISRGLPRWRLGYDLAPRVGTLVLTAGEFNACEEDARSWYLERLDRVGIDEIRRLLVDAQGAAGGIVLVCFEPEPHRCHRSWASAWLTTHDIDVQEFELPQGQGQQLSLEMD